MWDDAIPDDDVNKGCSNALASEAAPSSATSYSTDIVQRMARKPVNLTKVASSMGRGPIQNADGESDHRLKDNAQADVRVAGGRDCDMRRVDCVIQRKSSDDLTSTDHRGNRHDGRRNITGGRLDDAQENRSDRRIGSGANIKFK